MVKKESFDKTVSLGNVLQLLLFQKNTKAIKNNHLEDLETAIS